MFRRKRGKGSTNESESFVWITFSDLLTTLFMVFMVIALWAISYRDTLAQEAEIQKQKGEQCVKDLQAAGEEESVRREALKELSKKITSEFVLLQKSGVCVDARVEENEGAGGFRIFQNEGLQPWFEDGKSALSKDAQLCLRGIGGIWVQQINASKALSKNLKHILIEGHANSNPFPGITEEENFLRNLGLSQERALQAARFLIEEIKVPVYKDGRELRLRELMVAQGKSYLEPIFDKNNHEDLDRSKRLEFKIVLGSVSDGT